MDNDNLAVITGGASGIGLAVSRRLLKDGYDVIITGRNVERGQEAEATLRASFPQRDARFVALDHTDWSHTDTLNAAIGNRSIAVVVASAAVGLQSRVMDTPPETFLSMIHTNVVAPLHLIQQIRSRLGAKASIILISSDAGVDGEQALGAYSVTKAALNMLGRMMALDLACDNIRVNVVCPGDTYPGMRHLLRQGETERSPDDYLAWPLPPKGRIGHPDDTAALVSFLASDAADFMVGTVTVIDGGSRAGRPDNQKP